MLKENCTFWGGLAYHPQSLHVRQEQKCLSLLCVFSWSVDGHRALAVLPFNGSSGDTLLPPSKVRKTHPKFSKTLHAVTM